MTDTSYLQVNSVKIGYDAGHCTTITRVAYYGDREVTPHSDGEVELIEVINLVKPVTVDGRHKAYEIVIGIDSSDYEAFYTQQVQVGDAASRAIKDAGDNDVIEYLVIELQGTAGTITVTWEASKVQVVGEHSYYSNRAAMDYQITEYRLTSWGNRGET